MKIEQVDAAEVEQPASVRAARKYREVYVRVAALDVGKALRLTFDSEKEMLSAYASFRAALVTKPRDKTTIQRALALKVWDVVKHTAAKSLAIIRLPDLPPAEGGNA